jgi:beta-glucosidase
VGKHQIGLVVNLEPKYSASSSEADLAATKRAEAYMNRQYLDMALGGKFSPELVAAFGEAWPDTSAAARTALAEKIDFLGINYYTRSVTKHDPTQRWLQASSERQPLSTYTETGWEVFPQALTEVLLWVKQNYGDLPIYITENGAAFYDPPVAENGEVDDPLRVSYFRSHLRAVWDALQLGVDVRGYFAWSLLDNFEWGHGYSKRFGLVHVNYGTQERTIKSSGKFYRDVIRNNRVG